MKTYYKIVLMFILTGFILSGCSDNETAPSQESQQLKKLSGTWVVTSVIEDGTDKTSEYSSFELTLSGSANAAVYAYGVIGRPLLSPWLSEGTWVFGTELTMDLIRDPGTFDQLQMNYSVSDTQLTIEFVFNGTGYNASSKAKSVAGEWVYSFSRK